MTTIPTTTIFEALRDDHDIQRSLARKLIETSGDSAERRSLFLELTAEMAGHADHEERQFYIPLMRDDLTQEKARHSVAEHKDLEDLIEKLEETEMDSPQWLVTAKDLHHLLGHHLAEEEHEVFQLAGKVLTENEKTELARNYRSAMAEVRAASSDTRASNEV